MSDPPSNRLRPDDDPGVGRAPGQGGLEARLRAAREAPGDPEGWRALATAATRAGDHGLARYALEAGLEAAGADFAEAARASAGLGLAPQDPRRRIPEGWFSIPFGPSRLRSDVAQVPPTISPCRRWVAFASSSVLTLFELSTLACVARVSLGRYAVPVAWSGPGRLVFPTSGDLETFRLVEVDVGAWSPGMVGTDPGTLPGRTGEPRDLPGRPLALLADGRVLYADAPGELDLIPAVGPRRRASNPRIAQLGERWVRGLVGPGGQVLVSHVAGAGSTDQRRTSVFEVLDASPSATSSSTATSRVVLELSAPVDPLGWDAAGWFGELARVDAYGGEALVAVGAPSLDAEPTWSLPLDDEVHERVTGATDDDGLLLSSPGRYRVIDRATGETRDQGRLPDDCVAFPLDEGRWIGVRPGRFEVLDRRPRARHRRRLDAPGPLVALGATPTHLLLVHGWGKVRWIRVDTGEVVAEVQAAVFPEGWYPGFGVRLQVDFDHRFERALVPTPHGVAIHRLDDLAVIAQLDFADASLLEDGDAISTAALSGCGQLLVVGTSNGQILRLRLPDLEALPPVRLFAPQREVELLVPGQAPDRVAALAGSLDRVFELDLGSGQPTEAWQLDRAPDRFGSPAAWATSTGYLVAGPSRGLQRLERGQSRSQVLRPPSDDHHQTAAGDPAADRAFGSRILPEGAALFEVFRLSTGARLSSHLSTSAALDGLRFAAPPGTGRLYLAEGEVATLVDLSLDGGPP